MFDSSKKYFFVFLALSFLSFNAWTAEYEDYDTIVNHTKMTNESPSNFDLNDLTLHFNTGFNHTTVLLKNSPSSSVSLNGFVLGMGIDLFSPNLIAEVSYVNYQPTNKGNEGYKLKEFDLRNYYIFRLNKSLNLRAGGGLGVRYYNISKPSESSSITTPSLAAFLGAELKPIQYVSFITELGYKSALTSDSPEKSSIDLRFQVVGHF